MSFFIIDIKGTQLSTDEQKLIKQPAVVGVLLFTRNFETLSQLQNLTAEIVAHRADIFIAIDHEGGYVQRLQRHGFSAIPAAKVFGKMFDCNTESALSLAAFYGHKMAQDLLEVGIDLGMAPVLDIDGGNAVISGLDRALHANPGVVSQLAKAFITGMREAGMPAVGKHFPGHGSCLTDSHRDKPYDYSSEEILRKRELYPFSALIKQQELAAIMPAHVTYPAIDAQFSAGFSSIWLKDIARKELRFDGLIISDCLGMVGADIGDMKTRVEHSFKAGCDVVIICNQSIECLTDILSSPYRREASAHRRLQDFKKKMLRFSHRAPSKRRENFVELEELPSAHKALNTTKSV